MDEIKRINNEPSYDIKMAVMALDIFTKTYCQKDTQGDLEFRCNECPFQTLGTDCMVKAFKCHYAPDYKDFGAMGDL